ncbi:MAG TPA: hypothetical protein VF096_03905 [Azonexus sp.]
MDRQSNPFHARPVFARAPQSLFGKLLTVLFSIVFLVLAFMFSLVALAVVAVGGTLFAGWLWWKTRALRKAMRDAAPAPATARRDEQVIEGEFVREAADSGRQLR